MDREREGGVMERATNSARKNKREKLTKIGSCREGWDWREGLEGRTRKSPAKRGES